MFSLSPRTGSGRLVKDQKNTPFFLWLVLLSGLLLAMRPLAPEAQSQAPSPSLLVYLDHDTLRSGQPIAITIWINNASASSLSQANLIFTGPDFLLLRPPGCAGAPLDRTIPLGTVAAHSTLPPTELCLDLAPSIQVGDFNLLFMLQYHWDENGQAHESLTSQEEKVSVDVLGASSLLGIPLAFSSFILPGLAFLFIAGLWIPKINDLKPDARLFSSVLISSAIIAVGLALSSVVRWAPLGLLDIGYEISLAKLAVLAMLGGGLGLLAGRSYQRWYTQRQEKEKARLITPTDDRPTILKKMLVLNPQYEGRAVQIQLKNGKSYQGAHWALSGSVIVLAAAFQIDREELPTDVAAQVKQHLKDGELEQTLENLNAVLDLIKPLDPKVVAVRNSVRPLPIKDNPPGDQAFENFDSQDVVGKMNVDVEDFKLLKIV
jgi:hypothetical protein